MGQYFLDGPSILKAALGPLPTAFTPAPSCVVPYITRNGFGFDMQPAMTCLVDPDNDNLATPTKPPDVVRATDCYPKGMGPIITSKLDELGYVGYYSPAVDCPSGFTRACSTIGATSSGGFLSAGETLVDCCMSGYGCDSVRPLFCTRSVTKGQVVTGTHYGAACTPTTTTLTAFDDAQIGRNPRIHLLFAASESRPSSGSSIAMNTNPGSVMSSATPTAASIASSDSTPSSGQSSQGLTTGSKIAIGVIVPAVVIAMLILGVLIVCQRRRRRAAAAESESENSSVWTPGLGLVTKAELDASQITTVQSQKIQPAGISEVLGCISPTSFAELSPTSFAELSPTSEVCELRGTTQARTELM